MQCPRHGYLSVSNGICVYNIIVVVVQERMGTLRNIPREAVRGSVICTVSSRMSGLPLSASAKDTYVNCENCGRDNSASSWRRAKSTRSSSWHSKRMVCSRIVATCLSTTNTHGQYIDAARTNFLPNPKFAESVIDSSSFKSSSPMTATKGLVSGMLRIITQ